MIKDRNYLVYLLEAFSADVSLKADIVRSMSIFDPTVLLSLAVEQASPCFSALYNSFHLRGWLDG